MRPLKPFVLVACASILLACGRSGSGADTAAPAVADATVAAKETAAPPADPHKVAFDSAQKHLREGRAAFDEGDYSKAIIHAQAGVTALGDDYLAAGTADETAGKIDAAKQRAEAGDMKDAATVLLRMLDTRVGYAHDTWKMP